MSQDSIGEAPQAAQIYIPEAQFFVFSVDSLSTLVTRINFPFCWR